MGDLGSAFSGSGGYDFGANSSEASGGNIYSNYRSSSSSPSGGLDVVTMLIISVVAVVLFFIYKRV